MRPLATMRLQMFHQSVPQLVPFFANIADELALGTVNTLVEYELGVSYESFVAKFASKWFVALVDFLVAVELEAVQKPFVADRARVGTFAFGGVAFLVSA